jgi:hypothetical protein
MALLSYPIARALLGSAERGLPEELPSPYQFGLLLGLGGGGIGALWDWLGYMFGWKAGRTRCVPVIKWAAGLLIGVLGLR